MAINNRLLQEALAGLEGLNDVDGTQQSIAVGEEDAENNKVEIPNVVPIACGDGAEG